MLPEAVLVLDVEAGDTVPGMPEGVGVNVNVTLRHEPPRTLSMVNVGVYGGIPIKIAIKRMETP